MKSKILVALVAIVLMIGLANCAQAQTAVPKKSKIPAALKAQAKISLEDARATAIGKVPGELKEEELEKEHGKLVYSFDIQAKGDKDITEVQVSAIDGSIVSVEKEDAASEAKEKQEEQSKQSKSAAKP
jgi:hypothetical protein